MFVVSFIPATGRSALHATGRDTDEQQHQVVSTQLQTGQRFGALCWSATATHATHVTGTKT
jgi:hypothetical protein